MCFGLEKKKNLMELLAHFHICDILKSLRENDLPDISAETSQEREWYG